MACEIPFPAVRAEAQIFKLFVHARKLDTAKPDMAAARGVLLAPRKQRESRDQEFLVLADSLIRKTQGESDQPAAAAARDKMRAFGALEDLGDVFERVTQDVAFPSISRAANFLCGRNENGWRMWRLDSKVHDCSLSEAYDKDLKGELELVYYEPPQGVIWIPR